MDRYDSTCHIILYWNGFEYQYFTDHKYVGKSGEIFLDRYIAVENANPIYLEVDKIYLSLSKLLDNYYRLYNIRISILNTEPVSTPCHTYVYHI